jgi:hypothetical protein
MSARRRSSLKGIGIQMLVVASNLLPVFQSLSQIQLARLDEELVVKS